MIGWVDTLCKDWAAHKNSVHGHAHIQPIPGTLGSVRSEGLSAIKSGYRRIGRDALRAVATRNTPVQRHPEVWSPNALAVQRVVDQMPAEIKAVMTVQYLYPVSKYLRPVLFKRLHGKSLSVATFYRKVDDVHYWIAAKIY
jgi:hypothetical protein